jgi:tetratricopeptide (TPR) repeat protein
MAITPSRFRAPEVTPKTARWYAKFANLAAATQWFDNEQHNLVRMCELATWASRPDICWRLAYALRDFYFRTKRWAPWIRTHQLALDAAAQCEDRWAEAVTRNNLGLAYAETEQFGPANEQYARALEIFRELGDRYGEANAIGHQAWVMHCVGRNSAAIRLGGTALRFYESHNVNRNAAITLRTIALAEAAVGNFDAALGHLDRALKIFAEEGLVLDETMTLNCIGEVYAQAPDPARATKNFRAARRLGRRGGSTFEQARALRGLAAAAAAVGRPDEAARLVNQAQTLHAGYRPVPRQTARLRDTSGAH